MKPRDRSPRVATSRRSFLKRVAVTTAALPLASIIRGAPNEKLNIAAVGVGGKGASDIAEVSKGQNVVAICDVDDRTLGRAAQRYEHARRYHDWRKMLEQGDIDAVTVSTPDHMHAPAAVSAMQLGKHVYVQKPLSHTIVEARRMRLLAKRYGVVTQMGNQGHSGRGYPTVVRLVRDGVVGKVREAHAWSNRPIWPQGIDRPERTSEVPDDLHWDLWLGVAPARPYVGPAEGSRRGRGPYHPFNWRGWLDFGTGALGDMGCHIIDPVFWSLGLDAPRRVWSDGPAPNEESHPRWEIIHFEFPGTEYTARDTVRMTWYDGGRKPDHALTGLADSEKVPSNGCLLIGERGTILCPHGGNPVLLPAGEFAEATVDLVDAKDHYMEWTNACKGEGKTSSSFDYAGPLTETVLLGTVAVRFPWRRLEWNAEKLEFPNAPEATRFLHKRYRQGWGVDELALDDSRRTPLRARQF